MIDWFDCHAEFGRRAIPAPIQVRDAAGLAALYAEIGINRALVVHPAMYEIHPLDGNARVIAETRDYPQFAAAWALLPPQTGELGSVPDFLAAMKRDNIRALWAFCTGYPLNAVTLGPLLEEMVARKIPLFVKVASVGGWPAITGLLQDAPGLRLVACITNCWGEDRIFRPLLERYPGFHISTSMYYLESGLRDLCGKYGSRQFIFGTDFPDVQPGGSMMSVLHSGISDDDVQAIAAGNLRRLLAEVTL